MVPSLLDTYFQFLRSPNLHAPPEDLPLGKSIKQILRLYTPHFLLVMAAGALITQFSGAQDDNLMSDVIIQMSVWQLLLATVVAAPVIEESIFRLPLRPFAVNIAFSGSIVAFFLIVLLAPFPSFVLGGAGLLAGLNLYLWVKRPQMQVFRHLYERYAGVVFYFLTLVFGGIHITNYEPNAWPLLPLLVLPQVIVSLWLGFVRLRYGFQWAIFAHAFHNGCLLLPICVTKLLGSAQLQANGFENLDVNTLSISDQLLVGGIGLYMGGGLVTCVWVAWKLLQERASQRSTPVE